jgi:(2Fe-2S) ferredoxin
MTSGLIGFRWWKEVPMLKNRTHFEQVPLETVRKIVKEQLQREARIADEIEGERPETAFAVVEEPSMAELATFLAGNDRNDS